MFDTYKLARKFSRVRKLQRNLQLLPSKRLKLKLKAKKVQKELEELQAELKVIK